MLFTQTFPTSHPRLGGMPVTPFLKVGLDRGGQGDAITIDDQADLLSRDCPSPSRLGFALVRERRGAVGVVA